MNFPPDRMASLHTKFGSYAGNELDEFLRTLGWSWKRWRQAGRLTEGIPLFRKGHRDQVESRAEYER
jgi:hypothetical protein